MADPLNIAIAFEVADSAKRVRDDIGAGLKAFSRQHVEATPYTEFAIGARMPDGQLIGGLTGNTKYLWLYVEQLWITERHRGNGLGRRLLRAAEAHARSIGCKHAYVDTYDFQARPFYEREGYRVFGEQKDYPPRALQVLPREVARGAGLFNALTRVPASRRGTRCASIPRMRFGMSDRMRCLRRVPI